MPDLALDPPREQPLYLTSPRLTEAGLPHLVSTRHFPGVTSPRDPGSPFDADALRLVAELDLHAGPPAFLRQVHGADVLAAGRRDWSGGRMWSHGSRVALAIFGDCVPPCSTIPWAAAWCPRRVAGTAAAAARRGGRAHRGGWRARTSRPPDPVVTVLLRGRPKPVIERPMPGFGDRRDG